MGFYPKNIWTPYTWATRPRFSPIHEAWNVLWSSGLVWVIFWVGTRGTKGGLTCREEEINQWMVVSGSRKRWQVAYNPPIRSIYHLYIAFWGIICLLGVSGLSLVYYMSLLWGDHLYKTCQAILRFLFLSKHGNDELVGGWTNPIWKICSSNWIISPGKGENKK